MHPCLHIQEILLLVFDYVWHNGGTDNRQSILALMKTCQAFREPAIRLLWQDLDDLIPLLLTTPDDLWEIEQRHPNRPILSFSRKTEPRDWVRFDGYAPFVKHIGKVERQEHRWSTSVVINDAVWDELERRETILLPDIRRIIASSGSDLRMTSILLTPGMTQLKIIMDPTTIPALNHLAACLPVRAPSLKILELSQTTFWRATETSLTSDAFEILLGQLDLEELEFAWFPLTDAMTSSLLRMPSLRVMTIVKNMPDLARSMSALTSNRNYQMKRLNVITDTPGPSDFMEILHRLDPSILEVLRIGKYRSFVPPDLKALAQIVSTIGDHCWPAHFREFHFDIDSERDESLPFVTFPVLRPLLQFSFLRKLALTAYPFDLTDEEVKKMAMAWPDLEQLHFKNGCKNLPCQPRTTIRGLLWFATYCRKLKYVAVDFRGGDVAFSDAELALAADNNLSWLNVGQSTISDPALVAAFFNVIFPRLSILLWNDNGEGHNARWREVEALIQT